MSWARLLKRVFDIDMEPCPHWGGTLKIIAAIVAPGAIAKILNALGLPTRAPPRAPAQTPDYALIADSILVKKPAFEPAVEQLAADLREAYPDANAPAISGRL